MSSQVPVYQLSTPSQHPVIAIVGEDGGIGVVTSVDGATGDIDLSGTYPQNPLSPTPATAGVVRVNQGPLYVDSATGSDLNDGLSAGAARATLSSAVASAATAKGTVMALQGTHTLTTGEDPLSTFDKPGVHVQGMGKEATKITAAAGRTATMLRIGDKSSLKNLSVIIPSSLTSDAIEVETNQTLSSSAYRHGVALDGLHISGGVSASAYALHWRNVFRGYVGSIVLDVGCNGVHYDVTHDDYNYGNQAFGHIEISLSATGRIGHYFDGTQANTRNVMLSDFGYISAVTGVGTGSTGIKIRNCAYLSFGTVDIEGCATSIDIDGAVSGGQIAYGLYFGNIYLGSGTNMLIGSGARGVTFGAGRILGTYTDSGLNTRFGGVLDSSGNPIVNLVTTTKYGPRFVGAVWQDLGPTIKLRNQSGATVAKGTLVRPGSVDYGFTKADIGFVPTHMGVLTASTANGADGDVGAPGGLWQVLSTNAVARGDYMILDPATAGSAKSNGTTDPATPGHFLGLAMQTIGSAGLVGVAYVGFRPV